MYEFYVDVFFFYHFLLNAMSFYLLKKFFHFKLMNYKIILASLLTGLVSLLILLYCPFSGMGKKVLLCIGIPFFQVCVINHSFSLKIKRKIVGITCFCSFLIGSLVQYVLSGYLNQLKMKERWITIIGIFFLGEKVLFSIYEKNNRPGKRQFAQVTLFMEQSRLILVGLIDSGNCLREPRSEKAVCILQRDAMSEKEDIAWNHFVTYKSLGKEAGELPIIPCKKLQVCLEGMQYEYTDVWIGVSTQPLSQNGSFQILLPPLQELESGQKVKKNPFKVGKRIFARGLYKKDPKK